MPFLYIVSTPIGNLKDISQRALEILKGVDYILAENPKITRKLLSFYKIKTPLLKYRENEKIKNLSKIISLLKKDKNLALVSDGGTPGISDPGNKLIGKIYQKFKEKVKISPIPGPSALTAIVSACHFPMSRFLFLGFLPKKRKRKKFLKEILNSDYPVIFYESPYRILETLRELKKFSGDKREIIIGKELTKKFETIYRGKLKEILKKIKREKPKGEYVVIFNKKLLTFKEKKDKIKDDF